jgi:hypothetical protein
MPGPTTCLALGPLRFGLLGGRNRPAAGHERSSSMHA